MARAAIIGAGVIGLSWAELFHRAGWEVAIFDVSPDAVPQDAPYRVAHDIADAVRGAAFVQENGPERLEVKRSLLAEIAAAANDDAVISSSTSSLLPSLLAEGNARAEQIVVGHPYNPPAIMPLVEIVPAPTTRPEIVQRTVEVYRALGKRPVALAREIPGFVGNRIQKAVLDEAMWLVQQGIVEPADLDTIVQHSLGLRWASIGVFEASHLGGGPGGLRHIMEHVGAALNGIELERPSGDPADLTRLVEAVEASYGSADTYAARAARRDRITAAVAETVEHEQRSPSLFALTLLPGGVHRVDPTTGEVVDIAAFPGECPDGIVLAPERDELAVTLMGRPDGVPRPGEEPAFEQRNGSLQAVPLAGGAPYALVERGAFTTGKQLTRDPGTGRLYWCDREGRGVYRCEADGSDLTALVRTDGTAPTPAEEPCVGIAVDPVGGFLYWTQKGPAKGGRGRILRAGLELPDGQESGTRTDIETLWQDLPEPIDLELDPANGMIYWTDRGAAPDGNTLNRAPIPAVGQHGEAPQILARGFQEAIGLAVDGTRGTVYVADLSGLISAVDLISGAIRTVAVLPGPVTGIALAEGTEPPQGS